MVTKVAFLLLLWGCIANSHLMKENTDESLESGSGSGLENDECLESEEGLENLCDRNKDGVVDCQPGVEVRLACCWPPWEGRVEVSSPGLSDIWGSVCSTGWDDAAATVVCRELKIGNRGVTKAEGPLGCSCCPVYLASVNCNGMESNLSHCNITWGSHNCQQGDKAGVLCEKGCDPGTFMNAASQTCTPCPAGMFQTLVNSETCDLCPPDTFQRQTGQTSCTPCPSGQHQEQEGQRSCKVCPVGHFQHLTGQPSCGKCPEGTSTSSLGADHPNNCTESPASFSTVTVTMSFTLAVFCTKESALALKASISSQVYRVGDYTTGVCADPACSNTLVKTWCQNYTNYIVDSEIRFDNLPEVTPVSNGTDFTTKELLVHIVKETAIFQNLEGGATLQRDSVNATVTYSCPPNFEMSGTTCVYVKDNLMLMIGTAVGGSVALVAVIFLIIILVKFHKRKTISTINVEESSSARAGPTHEDEGYVFLGDPQAGKPDSIPAPMCVSLEGAKD